LISEQTTKGVAWKEEGIAARAAGRTAQGPHPVEH
jgi:hypothetical protein